MTLGCIGWITAVKGHFFCGESPRTIRAWVGDNRYALIPLGSLRDRIVPRWSIGSHYRNLRLLSTCVILSRGDSRVSKDLVRSSFWKRRFFGLYGQKFFSAKTLHLPH